MHLKLLPWQQQIMHHVMYYVGLNVHAKFPLHGLILPRDMFGFVFGPSQRHLVTSSVPNNFAYKKKLEQRKMILPKEKQHPTLL